MERGKEGDSTINQTIRMVEYEPYLCESSEIAESDAAQIYAKFGDKITIEWPTPKTNHRWQFVSQGWVGFIPINDNWGLSLLPKAPIQNLFGMLEYAYDLKGFKLLDGLYDCESIQDFYERLAIILSKRLLERTRQGLCKTYKAEYGYLPAIRGRIDISALSSEPVKTFLPCSYEDHTADVTDNRIIAWTLHTIFRSGICTDRSISVLRKAEKALRNVVSLTPFREFDCSGRTYNRLNADYEIMHKICRFFLDHSGPTHNWGDRRMAPFLVDMARLFERFVARWLQQNLSSQYLLKTQESRILDDKGTLKMVMDLLLCDRATGYPLCVLDTKYKACGNVSSSDYSQVLAYADAVGCENAILIYPKALDNPFDEKPGSIRVRTLVFDIGEELNYAGEKMLNKLYETVENIS